MLLAAEFTHAPVGKQRMHPPRASIFYTSNSGIWQTVWLEPVRDHLPKFMLLHTAKERMYSLYATMALLVMHCATGGSICPLPTPPPLLPLIVILASASGEVSSATQLLSRLPPPLPRPKADSGFEIQILSRCRTSNNHVSKSFVPSVPGRSLLP